MLSRQACHALKALLELAREPERWRSTHDLATAQQLPEPMLEQLLLRLRRAGLLAARRGRLGGFRLAQPPRELSIAAVLAGLGERPVAPGPAPRHDQLCDPLYEPIGDPISDTVRVTVREPLNDRPGDHVTSALERRLERARQQALEELNLQDLLYDLLSAEASSSDTGLLLG